MTTAINIRSLRDPNERPWWARVPFPLVSALVFFVTTATFYGKAFLIGGTTLCTGPNSDTVAISGPYATFIAENLRHGHFPLWCDRLYAGVPFVIGSTYFYPMVWLLAAMPVAMVVSLLLAGHVFLAGLFMSFWSRSRGISGLGSIVSGLIVSLGAASTLQLLSGHDTVLTSIAWMPLIFMAIDKLFEKPRLSWALAGAFFVCMSVFGGLAQLTYYGAILAGLYTAMRLGTEAVQAIMHKPAELDPSANPYEVVPPSDKPGRRLFVIGVLALLIYPLGALLSSVDLMPTVAINQETVRSNGLDLKVSGTSSEPPSMFVTLFDSTFWGDLVDIDEVHRTIFSNRANFWEVNCFIGAGALVLAVYGACRGQIRHRWLVGILIVICVVLAMGRYVPGYGLLAKNVPYYASFRAPSRFFIPMTIFLALLAGAGLDALPRWRVSWWVVGTIAGAGLIVAGVGIFLRQDVSTAGHVWADIQASVSNTTVDEPYTKSLVKLPKFIEASGNFAAATLFESAAWLAAVAALFALARYWSKAHWAVAGLIATELCLFAWRYHATANMLPPPGVYPQIWRDETAELRLSDPDARVANTTASPLDNPLNLANMGMLFNYDNIYGYNQIVLRRYAEFLASIQIQFEPRYKTLVSNGIDFVPSIVPVYYTPANNPGQPFWLVSPRLNMLRCRLVLITVPDRDGKQLDPIVLRPPDGVPSLPRGMLVKQAQILSRRDDILSAINAGTFNPRQSVILEQTPNPAPSIDSETAPDPVVKQIDCDHIEITADAPSPQILVMTDAYAEGWTARPFSPDDVAPQSHYDVLPADYALRAIPLSAGHHHIMLEYAPASVTWGLRITTATFAAWLIALLWTLLAQRRRRLAVETSEPVVVSVARVGGGPDDEPDLTPVPLATEADRLASGEPAGDQQEPVDDAAQEPTEETAGESVEEAIEELKAPSNEEAVPAVTEEAADLAVDDEGDDESEAEDAEPLFDEDFETSLDGDEADPVSDEAENLVDDEYDDEGNEAIDVNDLPAEPVVLSPPVEPTPIVEAPVPVAPPAKVVAPAEPPIEQPKPPAPPPPVAPPPMTRPAARAAVELPPAPPIPLQQPPAMRQPAVPPAAPASRQAVPPPAQPAPARPPVTPAKPAPAPPAVKKPGPAKSVDKSPRENWVPIPRFDGFGNSTPRRVPPRQPQPPAAPPKAGPPKSASPNPNAPRPPKTPPDGSAA